MVTINAKELRRTLPSVVRRVRGGSRFLVLYRSRPAFEIQPVSAAPAGTGAVEKDSLFEAPAVGSSQNGLAAADHDNFLYQA